MAQWENIPFTSNHQVENEEYLGKVITKSEYYTRLKILSVVKGNVEPGDVDLMLLRGISWNEDGTDVSSGTSTDMPGDVGDLKQPCLWFLSKTRSWDESRKEEYLTASHYREIQPLALKEFYLAMGTPEARAVVPKLLSTDQLDVANRVLLFLCGDEWPWPYRDDLFFGNRKKEKILIHEEAQRVWNFIQSDSKELRPLATSVYAELSGNEGIANIRTLLVDPDPNVRGIAVGILAQHHDQESFGHFANSLKQVTDGNIVCEAIKSLTAWGDERVVPSLIGFLQNDKFSYQYGDDLGIPALKAQQALTLITDHEFPFDVELSQRAWDEAVRIGDKADRKRLLEQLAPGNRAPLVASAIGLPRKVIGVELKKQHDELLEGQSVVTIRLRNVSSRPVTILKEPSMEERSTGSSSYSYGSGADVENKLQEFRTLEPNESIEFEIVLTDDFLNRELSERRLRYSYLNNGNRQGLKAWIGSIDVEFGPEWKATREVKQEEEFWENGNLKAAGPTVNGQKLGEWNYFNLQGDRIRIEYFGTGRGTSICNPEHISNKGTGKRLSK